MAGENGTMNTEEPPPRSCCDILWIVTTMEGWLKLVEAIMTLLTFSILASDPISIRAFSGAEYEYLIFVATTAFIFVVLHIVLRITHLFEKLPSPLTHPLIGLVGCFLASLALLVGSAISFARGEHYGQSSLKSSGICGFISTALFFFEGVYFIFLYRRLSRRGRKAEMKEDLPQPPEEV
ncbi:uncharacterized protein LOC122947734 [Acropora millepora]|uniref:uncharacterized protein LOC122947734 n=1 Tax=Acropora millepora TaxID=45264 RepID=UPI001CF1CE64|nr:uncharacterized protein LOC122947734 [Acropora millepora]